METISKDEQEFKDYHKEYNLSLRKKKVNAIFLKKRFENKEPIYSLQKNDIKVKPEYLTKNFKNLSDLLCFCAQIFDNKMSTIDDVKFAIYLLKVSEIKNDKGEVSKSNIIKSMIYIFDKYIKEKVIIDELLSILINFSFYLSNETNMNLLNKEYLLIYSKLSKIYFKDDVIFNDLITLLGNLSEDNITAQNIFYSADLFEEIYKLSLNEKTPKNIKNSCVLFLAQFSNGLQNNNSFVNNQQLLKKLIDLFLLFLNNSEYTFICLHALGNLSEIEIMVEYISKQKELFQFIFNSTNKDYYTNSIKILCNVTSVSENINLYIIKEYNLISFLLKGLNSSSSLIKGQILFIIGNLTENKPSEINQLFFDNGIFDKIFDMISYQNPDILAKIIYIINILTSSLDKEGIFLLYRKNIHLSLINILKNGYNRDIIDMTIDAIIDFLQKDTQDFLVKQSFIDNGLKEILSNLIMNNDIDDSNINAKTEEILQNYF